VQHALGRIRSWPVPHAAAGAIAFGRGDVETASTTFGEGDLERRFPLASVTKLLTAVAVLVAVEEGSIGLDDPVDHPPGATVRDLLAHSSGLAPDRDDVLAAPRRKRIYSSRGYELLAQLVEERTGLAFGDYLHEGVLEPLGMRSTSLDGSPAWGAVSTVHDLLRFVPALCAHGGRVLSGATVADATTAQFPDLDGVLPGYGTQRPNPWGLGPEIRGDKSPHWTGTRNSPRTFGHFGRAGTFVWIDPDLGAALVVLTDRDFGGWAIPLWSDLSDAVVDAAAALTRGE
jgi:CubicO group peptidase (beta-lactamase class C family)